MIERVHLSIISALHRHGTLTRAAEELCLTQSALSHMIGKLSAQLGCTLWRREGRRLHLTEAGRYLLKVSTQVLPLLEKSEETLRQYGEGRRGTLRIGIECHPCYQWLLRVVDDYLCRWPDVDLDVTERFQFSGVEALQHQHIDMLLTPDPVLAPSLSYDSVLDYELMLVVSADHPLAGRRYATPGDLAAETLLTYPVPRERLDVFTRFLSPESVEPPVHRRVETTEIMLQLVAAGRGVTTLPDYTYSRYAGTMPLTALHLGPTGMQNRLYLGYRSVDAELDYLAGFVEQSRLLSDAEPG